MAMGNMDSIARLIAREMRAGTKKTCPKCKGWVVGEADVRKSAEGCTRCGGEGWI